jgi:hypothetical protein
MSSSSKSIVEPFTISKESWSTITLAPFFSKTLEKRKTDKYFYHEKSYHEKSGPIEAGMRMVEEKKP